jgi:hypothetical protein
LILSAAEGKEAQKQLKEDHNLQIIAIVLSLIMLIALGIDAWNFMAGSLSDPSSGISAFVSRLRIFLIMFPFQLIIAIMIIRFLRRRQGLHKPKKSQ